MAKQNPVSFSPLSLIAVAAVALSIGACGGADDASAPQSPEQVQEDLMSESRDPPLPKTRTPGAGTCAKARRFCTSPSQGGEWCAIADRCGT